MFFASYRVRSQLSLAIFTASRTYVVAEKSSKQFQTPLKSINPYEPTGGFTSLREIPHAGDRRSVPIRNVDVKIAS